MTAPSINLEDIVPSKAKTWVALVGTLLTFVGPYILAETDALPAWAGFAVGLFFFIATVLGVYKAPYKPAGTTLAPDTPEVAQAAIAPETVSVGAPSAPPSGGWTHPWKNRR
jgi:hypothetical protein